jgi:hypothetical protein
MGTGRKFNSSPNFTGQTNRPGVVKLARLGNEINGSPLTLADEDRREGEPAQQPLYYFE